MATQTHNLLEEQSRLHVWAATGSKRGIARQYGLTPDAVERHAAAHLPQTLLKAEQIKEIAHANGLLADLQNLITNGWRVLEWAEGQQTVEGGHLTLAAIRELRKTFGTLANTATALKAEQNAAKVLPTDAVREELDRWLDDLDERLRQAEAAMPKCPPAQADDFRVAGI